MDHRLEELQRGHDDDADISASTVRPSHNIAAAAAAAAPYPAGSHYQAGPSSEGPQELGVLMPGQTWEQNREQFQGTFGRSSQGSLLSTSSPSGGRPSGESLARLGFIPGTSAGAGMGRSASADGVSPPVESGSTKGKGKERELHALPAEHWQDQPGMLGPVAQHSKDASGSTDRTERRAPSPALGVPPSGSGQTFGSTATGKRSRSQSPLPHTYGVGERGGSDFGPLARVLTNEQRQYLADREGGAEETDESAGQLAPPTRGRTGRSKSSPTLPLRVLPASPRLGPQGDPPIGQRSIGRGRTDSDRGGSGSGSRTGRRGRGTSRPERALSSPSRPRPCSTSGLVDVMLTGDAAERQRRRRTPPSWAPTPPVRSDSIPRRTPTLSFPPYGLPVGHRASMIASSDAPAESSNEALRAAFTKRRSRVSATRSMAATQAYASGHGSPGRASGYGYPAYLAGDSEGLGLGLSEPGHTHASLSTLTASQARARARWHLSSLATLRPRLPEDSAIVLAKLRYDSVFARVHHVFLPILAYAHVPATIFLDYNAIYTLVQVALHPETDADGESRGGVRAAWWIAMGVYAAMFVIWLFGIVVAYEALWCFVRHWRTSEFEFFICRASLANRPILMCPAPVRLDRTTPRSASIPFFTSFYPYGHQVVLTLFLPLARPSFCIASRLFHRVLLVLLAK